MDIFLYQTLEDRENPELVERDGPFCARSKTAWLGEGYYFWDSHIELAHWWGQTVYNKSRGYIICRSRAIVDRTCWDLHGNGTHRLEFEKACEAIIKKNLANRATLLVPQVIHYLSQSGTWPFKAVRALAMSSISYNSTDHFVVSRVKFKRDHISFLDLRPPVQLCLLTKKALSLKEFSIVYPDHYVDFDYA